MKLRSEIIGVSEHRVAQAPPHERFDFLGCPVDALDMQATLDRVQAIILSRRPHQHMAMNAAKFSTMERNPELRAAVRGSDLVNADGASVVLASRLLGRPLPERVAGIDLFLSLVARSGQKGWRLYFLGATQEVLEKTIAVLQERHPDMVVAGFRNGYFKAEDEPMIAQGIRESGADALFVAISSPKKETFLARWMPTMGVPFCMGVGGSFDVVAGVSTRAPLFMQRAGLEWFYRFIQEPGRLGRRMWVENGRFALRVLRARTLGYRLPD